MKRAGSSRCSRRAEWIRLARTPTVPVGPLAGEASAPFAQEERRQPSPNALSSPTADADRQPNQWTPPPTPAIVFVAHVQNYLHELYTALFCR